MSIISQRKKSVIIISFLVYKNDENGLENKNTN